MPSPDSSTVSLLGVLAVLVVVAANGFFVNAEFSLVAVRRTRAAELIAAARTNAAPLLRALDNLDANLAATQLGPEQTSIIAVHWSGCPAGGRRPWLPMRV